jgi:hypothetical protein
MNYEQKFAMSKYASKEERNAAINAELDKLARKRDYAADVEFKQMVAWSYQVDINKLVLLLAEPNAKLG